MASTETIEEISATLAAAPPAKAGLPLLPMMLAMLTAVVLALSAAGGVALWLYKTGRLPSAGDAHRAAANQTTEPVKPVLTQVVLEPVLVNLADGDGRSYLRVAVTLLTEQKPAAKGAKAKEEVPAKGKPLNEAEAAERDALLDVLGRQTGAALLQPDGKERLKQQILTTLKQRVPEVMVSQVLFTDFLVQR